MSTLERLEQATQAYQKKRDRLSSEYGRWYRNHAKSKRRMTLYCYHRSITEKKDAIWREMQPELDMINQRAEEHHRARLREILELPYEQWLEQFESTRLAANRRHARMLGDPSKNAHRALKEHVRHYQRYQDEKRACKNAEEARKEAEKTRAPDYSNILPPLRQCGSPSINIPSHILANLPSYDWLLEEGLQF